jgi:hypothetical protein
MLRRTCKAAKGSAAVHELRPLALHPPPHPSQDLAAANACLRGELQRQCTASSEVRWLSPPLFAAPVCAVVLPAVLRRLLFGGRYGCPRMGLQLKRRRLNVPTMPILSHQEERRLRDALRRAERRAEAYRQQAVRRGGMPSAYRAALHPRHANAATARKRTRRAAPIDHVAPSACVAAHPGCDKAAVRRSV